MSSNPDLSSSVNDPSRSYYPQDPNNPLGDNDLPPGSNVSAPEPAVVHPAQSSTVSQATTATATKVNATGAETIKENGRLARFGAWIKRNFTCSKEGGDSSTLPHLHKTQKWLSENGWLTGKVIERKKDDGTTENYRKTFLRDDDVPLNDLQPEDEAAIKRFENSGEPLFINKSGNLAIFQETRKQADGSEILVLYRGRVDKEGKLVGSRLHHNIHITSYLKAAPAPTPSPSTTPTPPQTPAPAPAQATPPPAAQPAANGSTYEGETKDGLPHGQGTFRDENGTTLTGTFDNGRFVSGTKTNAEGNSWEGYFNDDGNLEGYWGVHRGPDGSLQAGNFKDGVLDGYGSTYGAGGVPSNVGLYEHGEHVEGTGVIGTGYTKIFGYITKDKDGKEIIGNGKFAHVSDPPGGPLNIMTGRLKDSGWDGETTIKYNEFGSRPGGLSFECNFTMPNDEALNDTCTGSIIYPSNGDHDFVSYTGSFDPESFEEVPPIPSGKGAMVFKNGDIFTGHFTNGAPDGTGTLLKPNGEGTLVTYKNGQLLVPENGELDELLEQLGQGQPTEESHLEEVDDSGYETANDTFNDTDIEENETREEDVQSSQSVQESHPVEDDFGIEYLEEETDFESENPFDEIQRSPSQLKFAEELKNAETLNLHNGVYTGTVVRGQPHGLGRLDLNPPADGTSPYVMTQEGTFRQGQLVKGKMYMSDGVVIQGDKFKDGKLEGKGAIRNAEGDVTISKFKAGNFGSKAVIRYGDSDEGRATYKGHINKNGKPDGSGVLTYTDGRDYNGEFTGRVFKGKFIDGELGKGTMETIDENGKKIKRPFEGGGGYLEI